MINRPRSAHSPPMSRLTRARVVPSRIRSCDDRNRCCPPVRCFRGLWVASSLRGREYMSIPRICITVPVQHRLRLVHNQWRRLGWFVRLTYPLCGCTARRWYGYKLQKKLVDFFVGYGLVRCRIPRTRPRQVGFVGHHDYRVLVFVAFLHRSALSKLLPPLAQALEGIPLSDIEDEDDCICAAEEGGGETGESLLASCILSEY